MMMMIMMKRRDRYVSGKFLLNIHYFKLNISTQIDFEHLQGSIPLHLHIYY